MSKIENEVEAGPNPDHNNHLQANMVNEDKVVENVAVKKVARLVKLNFLITFLGLGILGYLHFTENASISESISKSRESLKKELAQSQVSKEELQALDDKNTELGTKVEGYAARISGVEVQVEQLQEEVLKNARLSAKVDELQSLLKKGKASASSMNNSSKAKTTRKPVKKTRR